LTKKIQDAGTVVVNAKDGAGSATLSMAFAGLRFANALVRALHGDKVVECAFVDVESEKLDCSYFGLPVEIGKEGITKYHPIPKLSAYEQTIWNDIIPALKANIETGVTFGKA